MPRRTTTAATELSKTILRLMSHYWTADDPPATREAQIEDWIEDLIEFDLDIVREACAEWRRKPVNRRPLPGEIRAICFSEQQDRQEDRLAIESKNREQDGGTWSHYDLWGPASTGRIERQKAIEEQQEKYARGHAYQMGKLDEYDAIHWPERLAERRAKGINSDPNAKARVFTARDLGVIATPRSPLASYPEEEPF